VNKPKANATKLNMKNINSFVKFYKKLHPEQKMGLVMGAFAVLMLPIALFGVSQQVRDSSKAYETEKVSICKNYWTKDTKTACKPVHVCDGSTPSNQFKTETDCLTSLGVKCQKLWWFDDQSKSCAQKNFCGTYMYKGLQTYQNEGTCQKAFTNHKPGLAR
jgi:hypothetical protein